MRTYPGEKVLIISSHDKYEQCSKGPLVGLHRGQLEDVKPFADGSFAREKQKPPKVFCACRYCRNTKTLATKPLLELTVC